MPEPEVTRTYARALYEVAAAQGLEERIAHDLTLVRDLWQGDPEFTQPFLIHPLIHAETKEAALERALGPVVHPHTLNLLRLLVRRGRATLLPGLAPAFFQEHEDGGKAFHVLARTARPFSPEEMAALRNRLAEVLGRPVTVEEVAAPDLLAGVELAVSGHRLDTSLRGRLAELMTQLRG
ncbi:MAG: ATP synthase F1 subunit delta [Candidatus Bipolaricaulota bacterium]